MYVDAERRGDYFDLYGLQPQHVEFANFMNEHCSEWTSNDRTMQSPLSIVCGQYCVAFLMFRYRNVSMHAFTRLFTTDLVANDCRVFDWLAAVNKKMMMMIRCVRVTSTTYLTYPLSLPAVPLSAPSQQLWSDFGVPIDEWRVNRCYEIPCSWLSVRVRTFVYFIAGTVDDVAFSDAERIAVPRPLSVCSWRSS